ncbi:hypothetical protein LDENG_00085480 [Lucifuga dentata]|nr:hypothetical protein LDENG_00085480 [Lucifuga dentata]
MLCEGRLWRMTYGELEEVNSPPPEKALRKAAAALLPASTRRSPVISHNSPEQKANTGSRSTDRSASMHISPLQSLDLRTTLPGRQISPEIQIPDQARSGADAPFLVPSFCQSICQNYSDLHIGGDQGREGPFSNSLLNRYLEHKLLDLYQQYMMENMAREGSSGSDSDPICPLLGSELVLTSLDQITLQLSREGNLEAGLAKDMVLSCLLRVASDMQSSEISTPFLQISDEASRDQLSDDTEE